MTCPHCRASLRRRERTGRRCARCGKAFALEPLETPFRLSDVRLREVARRLSRDGSLRFTGEQLYYAVQRPEPPVLPTPPRPPSIAANAMGAVVLAALLLLGIAATLLVPTWIFGHDVAGVWLLAALSAMLLLFADFVIGSAFKEAVGDTRDAVRERHRPTGVPVHYTRRQPLTDLETFRSTVLARWRRVHGKLPGLCDHPPRPEWAVPPVLAVACPSPAVRACLWANGVPVEVVDHPDDAPEGTPVAHLHDVAASAFVTAHARGLPDLTPRGAASWVRWHRLRSPAEPIRDALRAVPGLPARERDLLDTGWYCPVGAIPPAVLIRLVETHRRAVAVRDPDHRAAHDLGFLDTPGDTVGS